MTQPLSKADSARRALLGRLPRLVIFLDVDGTLAPIAPTPEAAHVPRSTRALLRRLRQREGATLVLVSGRHPDDARGVVGVTPHWTIGNHGYEVASVARRARPLVSSAARRRVDRAAPRIAHAIGGLGGVVLEHKGWTLAVHYRLAGPSIARTLWQRVAHAVHGTGVVLSHGKRVIDVRPGGSWNKGKAVRRLLRRLYGASWNRAGILYAGDDTTDEHVFTVLPRPALTIKVGRGVTRARYRTTSPATLAGWLRQLDTLLR